MVVDGEEVTCVIVISFAVLLVVVAGIVCVLDSVTISVLSLAADKV